LATIEDMSQAAQMETTRIIGGKEFFSLFLNGGSQTLLRRSGL
jgi:dihydrofolate reductase